MTMTLLEESILRHDALGRKQPRRLPLTEYIELMARSAGDRFREIPRVAIEEDGVDDDGPFAMVRCPCGRQPIVRYSIDKCAGCERYYVLCVPSVFVIYGDMEPPSRAVARAEASP
jgi:hypothetical protein